MIFRQLFEPISSTCTYLIGWTQTGKTLFVDTALPAGQRGLEEVRRLGLGLAFTVDTHIHADQIGDSQRG